MQAHRRLENSTASELTERKLPRIRGERRRTMGLLDKVERGIEKAVRGVFSTGSRAQVEPVEIASHLRRLPVT